MRWALGLALAFLLFGVCPAARAAGTLEDPALGFTLAIPDGFRTCPELVRAQPDVVHAFVRGDLQDAVPDILLMVEKMGGTIGRGRLEAAKMPPGFAGSLFTVEWHDFELDAFEVPEEVGGTEVVTYNVPVPLKRQAIQVKLFGPKERESELRSLLRQVLDGLQGESNWPRSAAGPSAGVRSERYGTVLLVVAVGAVVGGLLLLWFISSRTPRGTVLAISGALYMFGVALAGSRVREVVFLCGVLKLLGFAGGIGGGIGLLRKRR